ncbi:6-hydroxytryprostatin B O-methyltransferase protein [Rutstroemia sp. NJR-2017a WRK4]|nr:6-hydroxytryprostatin B O-methyltransferase protein [Rutstroemia sp. NJR-2017a WRK4]
MAQPSLSELAATISANTAKIENYLRSHDLKSPSFDVDAPTGPLVPSDAPELEAARSELIDATLMLHDLILGPKEYLMKYTHDWLLSIQAITRFNIAKSIPIHEEASYVDLAKECGINELDLRRIIRHAMTLRLFKEPKKDIVAHTAASRMLAEDQQVADYVAVSSNEFWPAAAQTLDAMVKWPGSQEPNETGFALANNTDKSLFAVLSQDPQRARRFGNGMKAFTEGTGYDLQYVVNNYPWEGLGSGTIVDVGGSHGFTCIRLAQAFPSLNFIVQDLPPVVAVGEKSTPSELLDRIKFMAYDFLTEQPVKNADVYFFRWIFHNWSDKYCIQILRNHIPAIKKGARIVINDNVLPEPGSLPRWREERLRSMDLTMLELQNSRERELEDWAKLFEKADPRFIFKGGKQPAGANLWILEAVWEGDGTGE